MLNRAPTPRRTPITTARLTPNWFAAVMGTGIVATSAAGLPVQVPGLRAAATAVWLVAATLLVVLVVATAQHWTHHRAAARRHHHDPVLAHFYGAPPMALMTVGAGALVVGPAVVGPAAALAAGWTLWTLGTVLGLASALVVPALRRDRLTPDERAFAGRLMPVVPPMVSAATGALLLPRVPAGPGRAAFAVTLAALFVVALVGSSLLLPAIGAGLRRSGPGPAVLVPTLWIVLGPLGQSTTAANALGGEADLVTGRWARALEVAGVAYGLPVMAFALAWAGLALTLTLRTARTGLPFALTWWSFTFPVGTCVTGLSALAHRTGSGALAAGAVVGFVVLVGAWATVAARTLHGAFVTRTLLAPLPVAAPADAGTLGR